MGLVFFRTENFLRMLTAHVVCCTENIHTGLDVHLNGYWDQIISVVWMDSEERYR